MTTRIFHKEACSCGCKGRDTWHRASYKRVLRDVREETGKAMTTEGFVVDYSRVAVAKFPWGKSRVVFSPTPGYERGVWFTDMVSYLDAQQ